MCVISSFTGTAIIMTEGKKLLSLLDDRLQVVASTTERYVFCLYHISYVYCRSQEVEQAQAILEEVREKLYQLE